MLITFLIVLNTFAADCQQDRDHAAICKSGSCELIDGMEVCTQCKAGGVPIDGFCRPVGSPRVITAGCTGSEGAPLDKAATTCGRCSGANHFLFMGGCYNQKMGIGGTICTAASGGECTACAKAGWLFENPSGTPAPGTKCILCSDVNGDGKAKGVENCAECTKPADSPGVATCDICRIGYVNKSNVCVQCGDGCYECLDNNQQTCTACFDGKYLSTDKCVDANRCGDGNYADPKTNECKACITAECATCIYNTIIDREQCIVCNNDPTKMVKIEANGETTCVDKATCATDNTPGSHFLSTNSQKCILCSDNSDADNQGIDGCSTCKKKTPTDAFVCTECLAGYIKKGSDSVTCEPCGANCATCTQIGDDQCTACKPGYFLKSGRSPSECIPCDGEGGTEGCGICSNDSNTFKCTDCKPNYHKRAGGGSAVTCEKFCEDSTACGGTAGTCGAIVVQNTGDFLHYCSLCGDPNTFPIDGKCVDNAQGNTCANGVCTQCAAGYFLYMGGCYSVTSAPGNLMCKTAEGGKCTAPNENNKYFLVPGAASNQQSVMACENPLGTAVGEKAYVGVEGCDTCTAPAPLTEAGMRPARCTTCNLEVDKPNLAGSGCFRCTVDGCSHCSANEVCEACTNKEQRPNTAGTQCISCNINGCTRCSEENKCDQCGDGYRLEGETCVQIQPNPCKTENCQECTNRGKENEVCTKCISTHYLTPTSQCVKDCTIISGYYGDADKKCKRCHDACAECVGPANNQCSACPAGRSLAYSNSIYPDNGGTCGDACVVDKNGCKVCGAKIGGTDYCSQCSDATQAPLNGNCAANTRAAFCTKMSTGACTQCENNYFLKDGGCYQTDRQPGKQVCSGAQGGNGKCQTCANGLAASDGNCGACHSTCATCSAAGAADKCKTCATGYYKTSDNEGSCRKCSEGLVGCRQCTASATAFVCLEMSDNTSGNVNKSGLSTGAIAGITAVAVIVVGGLVSFLCWWFIYRGKART
ncbi:VSP [Giardia lamblia P15]|uniref:VSP n=1 Tax=Giardia intestinalis (strain P15) TaxID=658858 RepID=E1F8P0_GIAIA|nr:VSP [Giardia lamblia P15]